MAEKMALDGMVDRVRIAATCMDGKDALLALVEHVRELTARMDRAECMAAYAEMGDMTVADALSHGPTPLRELYGPIKRGQAIAETQRAADPFAPKPEPLKCCLGSDPSCKGGHPWCGPQDEPKPEPPAFKVGQRVRSKAGGLDATIAEAVEVRPGWTRYVIRFDRGGGSACWLDYDELELIPEEPDHAKWKRMFFDLEKESLEDKAEIERLEAVNLSLRAEVGDARRDADRAEQRAKANAEQHAALQRDLAAVKAQRDKVRAFLGTLRRDDGPMMWNAASALAAEPNAEEVGRG